MATQTAHRGSVQSAVSSSMHTLEKAERLKALDAQTRKLLGLPAAAQSITFNNWSPDPWTVVGLNGAKLVTISHINLTVIKPDPPQKIFYLLSTDVKSEGWTVTPPQQPPMLGPLRLDFSNAQGGIVWSASPTISVQCGTNENQRNNDTIYTDIFSLISSAHLSIPSVTFWPY